VAELQGLGAATHELEAAGAQVLAISPDPNERSQELADRLRVGYRFLADTDLAVTRRLGLIHSGGGEGGKDVPAPATIVIDRAGVVRWAAYSDNFQTRPDPRDVLRAVKAL
jgi:peroxiredoxin